MSLMTETMQANGGDNHNHNHNGSNSSNGAHSGAIQPAPAAAVVPVSAMPALYADYAGAIQMTLNRMPWQQVHATVEALIHTWEAGRQVLLLGNGGSASTASHLACDLSKNTAQPGLPRMRAQALNDNMALITAYGNDNGYDSVFAEQLQAQAQPGDLVLAISTSGNSPNVLRAVELARRLGLRTVGFCGHAGGKLAALVDIPVITPNYCVEQIEDIHMMLAHVVTVAVRSAMQASLLRGAEFRNGVLVAPPALPSQPPALPAPSAPLKASAPFVSSTGNGYAHTSGHGGAHMPHSSLPGYWQSSVAPLNGHD